MKAILKIWASQKVGLRGNTQNLGWSKTCKSALIRNFYLQIFAKTAKRGNQGHWGITKKTRDLEENNKRTLRQPKSHLMTQLDQTQDSAALTKGNKKTISPTLSAIIGFILGVVFTSILMNWQDAKDGWQDGVQGKPPRYETKPVNK